MCHLKSENIVPGWLTKKLRRLHQFSNHHPMMTRLPKPEQNVPTGPVGMGGQNGQGGHGGLPFFFFSFNIHYSLLSFPLFLQL